MNILVFVNINLNQMLNRSLDKPVLKPGAFSQPYNNKSMLEQKDKTKKQSYVSIHSISQSHKGT